MQHLPVRSRRRRWRAPAVLAIGVFLPWTLLGCSGGDDSASTTTSVVRASSNGGGGNTEGLETACREADLGTVEDAAADFAAAQAALGTTAGEAAGAAATVELLDKGSVLFSAMASSLGDFFTALADALGQSSIADIPDGFRAAADDFSALATDINDAGTVTEADISSIEDVGAQFDELGETIESGSPGGDELRRVPACETFIRNFESVFDNIEGTDATATSGDTGGVNSDVANGSCDQERWLEDPDCGDEDVVNSDLADGACDDTRYFTDPDC